MANIELHVFGKTELVNKFRNIAANLPSIVTDEMKAQMVQTADYSRTNFLSGDPLHRRSGNLSRSIVGAASASGRIVRGTVGSKGVRYAFVHENGGVFNIPEHYRRVGFDSRGNRIKLLTRGGVERRQVRSETRGLVRAHTATYPKRAFLAPALQARRSEIIQALRDAIREAMNAA